MSPKKKKKPKCMKYYNFFPLYNQKEKKNGLIKNKMRTKNVEMRIIK